MFYTEPSKQIRVIEKADIIVVGAGPAGFAAAVNAARLGAKTVLVEQSGAVGGVATTGLMSHWTGNTNGGFYEELLERSRDNTNDEWSRKTINPERLKTIMLDMLSESGVKIKLYTFASDVILDGNKITGIIIESKSGREAIMGKVIIDASGDGDIAAKVGAPYYKGREEDGKMQPMTLMFKVGGVAVDKVKFVNGFEDTYETAKGDLQTLAKQNIPFPAGHVLIYKTTLPGIVTCNMTNCIDVDGTKADDLTKAEITCRSQIEPIIDFLTNYVDGFENCFIISSASIIGVRETRHFEGEKTLTHDDILTARVFEDWVVADAQFNFDVHNISGPGLDKTGVQKHFKQTKGYTIPYGCLIPKKIDGLLLAGRNISGTHLAHSSYRVMPICVNMGQAAGIAAALCAQNNVVPRNLDVLLVQQELKKQGVEI